MAELLLPIAKAYKYGVRLEYESEEIAIQFNNVPQETTDRYTATFRKLLAHFVKKVERENGIKLDFRLVLAKDWYEPEALYVHMKDYENEMVEVFQALSEEEKEVWKQRARVNFLVKGKEDFSKLSKEELDEKIVQARIVNECFLAADWDLRIDFWDRPNAIVFFGTWGKSPCASPTDVGLHLKSTSSSSVDFWTGTGILEVRENGEVVPRILSCGQFERLKDKLEMVKVDETDLGRISKNLEFIPVYRGKIAF